jgi:hypothetical protein
MFICAKCHEADKIVTNCEKPLDEHPAFIVGPCSICGKAAQLFFCVDYLNRYRYRGGTNVRPGENKTHTVN